MVLDGHLISQVYMCEMLRSFVLPFCAKTSESTRPRMTMPEQTSLESAKTILCALTGQFAHQTCLRFNMSITFWTEGPTQNNASRCSVAGDIDADLSVPNHKSYSEYTKPVLVLNSR